MFKLLVGLGNPGAEYHDTRHNAGFWLLDRVAQARRASLRLESKFYGLYTRSDELHLLTPQTFMNCSGRAVAAVANFYKILPQEILVVHDELDLPPGSARFKLGGGHGGHNGLRDIIAVLGTPDFWRLRIGVGHPGDKSAVLSFVLKPPRREEQELIDIALAHAMDALPAACADDMSAAMKQLHTVTK